jgi:hypothetical protein
MHYAITLNGRPGLFGSAVDSEKSAVSCELCKSCCEERTVKNLEVVGLKQL